MKWRLILELEPYDDKIAQFNSGTVIIDQAVIKAVHDAFPLGLKSVYMRGEEVEE
jgi:hypothetical protein